MKTVSRTEAMHLQANGQANHLTDDQFAECAIDAPSAESQAHLDLCGSCRQELTAFQASVGDFSTAAMHWSEAQPSVSLRAAAVPSKRQPLFAYAATALAAGLLIAVGAPLVRHHPEENPQRVAFATDDSAAQIAEDNRMMQTVNMAIGVSEPSPFREYQLPDARAPRDAAHAETRSE